MVKAFLAILLTVHAAAQVKAMKAGVARADIPPPTGVALWGYSNRAGPATGTRDPLYARVLLLDDLTHPAVALVTLDLGRTFGEAQMNWVRHQVRQDIEVIFSASHTHSGPWIEDEYPGGAVPA